MLQEGITETLRWQGGWRVIKRFQVDTCDADIPLPATSARARRPACSSLARVARLAGGNDRSWQRLGRLVV